ncbi:Os11g0487700 [Oryza sativa Japonica Group]|uniref:Os11g0487700 protein n=2 Tax=Oryza sativa subsp. japonica TaxID=39947 RepID=Q2R453_ORYSJ|nr:hypothetical protein LOC_Os11g29670 [Oryza sativa Japonica Group]KAB8115290.1 hypothetical protein EE612_055609 [Oryza sativa]BAH95273.1 Os11g0487700 [Oryza sativa Japonica Group]BAT14072.1 Os11g0487700 [Oryza sativa Japonica Group]|eukprot:NP_001176545.1 Os11g0487700 [Oryza sativa Japonica Group]
MAAEYGMVAECGMTAAGGTTASPSPSLSSSSSRPSASSLHSTAAPFEVGAALFFFSRSLLISLDAQLAAVSFSASAAAARGEELSALEEERLRSGSGTAAAREPGRRRVRSVSSKSSPNTADDWSGCVRLVLRLTDFAGVGLHGSVGCLPT